MHADRHRFNSTRSTTALDTRRPPESDRVSTLEHKRGRQPGPGLLVGGPIFDFYERRKKVATETMLRTESSSIGKSGTYGSFGPRKHSFIGIFDVTMWCTYIGLCRSEYEAFEKSYALYRTGGDPAIKIEVLDKILTNLGRPDLFAEWYGSEPFRGEEEEDEVVWAA